MSEVRERAHNAKTLLDDPTMQKAFEGVRQKFLRAIEDTHFDDAPMHHQLALCLQALRSVKQQLEKWVQDGEVEARRNG